MKIKINSKDLQKLVKDATRELRKIPREAHKYFKEITPRRNGYAQRNTVLINNQIQANYDYAGALDDGKSRQAPKGMSEPTIEQMEKEFVPNAIERINRG
jgi:hypothetical protein